MPGPCLQLTHLHSPIYSTVYGAPPFSPPEVWGTQCSRVSTQQGEGRCGGSRDPDPRESAGGFGSSRGRSSQGCPLDEHLPKVSWASTS